MKAFLPYAVPLISCGISLIVFGWPHAVWAMVSDRVVDAIIFVESSNRPWVENHDGCRGLGQINRKTWNWLCTQMGTSWSFNEAFHPQKNRIATTFYLNWLERYLRSHGQYSPELVWACYNAGPGTVRKYGWRIPPYAETRRYIAKIQTYLKDHY